MKKTTLEKTEEGKYALREKVYNPVFTSAAGRKAADDFCTPVLAELSPRGVRFLSGARQVICPTTAGPVVLYFWEPDSGTHVRGTVVLSHGWADSAACWAAFAGPLTKKGYRVAAPDFPGHNRTRELTGDDQAMLPRFMEAYSGVLDYCSSLGPVKAAIGHSLGALATFLVSAGALPVSGHPEKIVLIAQPATTDFLVKTVASHLNWSEKTTCEMKVHLNYRIKREPVPFSTLDDFTCLNWVNKLRTPLLHIHDRKDRAVPASDFTPLWDALQNRGQPVESLITDGLGHNLVLRAPAVRRRILEFLG